MSKIKTSMTDIKKFYDLVFRTGYCDLYYIFYNDEPRYYNSGVYGWNCDIYTEYAWYNEKCKSIAISTGYRNMRGSRIPADIVKQYTDAAKSIIEKHSFTEHEARNKALEENKQNFLQAVLEWYYNN